MIDLFGNGNNKPGYFCAEAGTPAQVEARLRGEGTPQELEVWVAHLKTCPDCALALREDALLKETFAAYRTDPLLLKISKEWKPDIAALQKELEKPEEIAELPPVSEPLPISARSRRNLNWAIAAVVAALITSLALIGLLVMGVPANSPAATITASTLNVWQSGGITGLQEPTNLTVDAEGNLYVIEHATLLIHKFGPDGMPRREWGGEGDGDGQFKNPWGITVDSKGFVYVVDSDRFLVQKFDKNGNFVKKWGSQGSGAGEFQYPTGIAADASNNLYVLDGTNRNIQIFDENGTFLQKWPQERSFDRNLNGLRGIAIDAAGNVYVTEWLNHRVQKFDKDGNSIAVYGGKNAGAGIGEFNRPWGIITDTKGNIFVTEQSNHRVQKIDKNGQFSIISSDPTNKAVQDGLALDSRGYLYIVDNHSGTIKRVVNQE